MKKITPDPPKSYPLAGNTLATAIINSDVLIQDVLMNTCHYFLLSHNSILDAYKACPEDDLKCTLITACRTSSLPGPDRCAGDSTEQRAAPLTDRDSGFTALMRP